MKHACTTLNNLLFYNGKASSSQNSSSLASTRHLGSLPSLLKLRVMTATPQHGAHTENVRSTGWQFVSISQKCDHQLVSLVLAVNTTQVYHCPSACGYSECGSTHSLSENAPQPYAHAHLHRPTHSTLHYIIVTLRSSGNHWYDSCHSCILSLYKPTIVCQMSFLIRSIMFVGITQASWEPFHMICMWPSLSCMQPPPRPGSNSMGGSKVTVMILPCRHDHSTC